MDDGLFEREETQKDNQPAFSVSEISGALKRVVEDRFGHVRIRGEVGRCSRPASGHLYLALKDDKAVIDGVIWKGAARKLTILPEEGMEVIATGKLTTYPGSSKYQIVIEALEPAGAGALMAMLEARKKALAGEGLFDAERKQPIPLLPEVIGVITSPSGAVIRDILHRVADRFPRRVLVWPVAVQGKACAPEVTAALNGFNALAPNGPIPRPDVLIVARGGGSLEDLWGFNEEAVVRAVAQSKIPVISAVGHETDVTLVDHAADLRAPTPTAAAEKAVPVRAEMAARLGEYGVRGLRAVERAIEGRREVLRRTARALPRPAQMVGESQQRLDLASERLRGGLRNVVSRNAERVARARGRLSPALLTGRIREAETRLKPLPGSLRRAADTALGTRSEALRQATRTLEALSYRRVLERGYVVVRKDNAVVTGPDQISAGDALSLEFAGDKHIPIRAEGEHPRKRRTPRVAPVKASQPDLFEE